MATKKTEKKEEPAQLPMLEDLWKMKFQLEDGTVVMVRKAYSPRGKLEIYQPMPEG